MVWFEHSGSVQAPVSQYIRGARRKSTRQRNLNDGLRAAAQEPGLTGGGSGTRIRAKTETARRRLESDVVVGCDTAFAASCPRPAVQRRKKRKSGMTRRRRYGTHGALKRRGKSWRCAQGTSPHGMFREGSERTHAAASGADLLRSAAVPGTCVNGKP